MGEAEINKVETHRTEGMYIKEGDVSPANIVYHEANLKRGLVQRHLMMMAIGGVIGPGYFVGMGVGLTSAGPSGLLLCFGIVRALLWAVMQCLGELGALIPVSGLFVHYAARFIDPAVGFALDWNYWFLWAGILMAEYSWIMIFWCMFMAFQMLGVTSFGEAEFWLALLKILAIAAFFLCAILITIGVIGRQKIGSKFYCDPGPFAKWR